MTKALKIPDRLPSDIYYVTSDGTNELPGSECEVHFILDENVHLRLSRLDWQPMADLRKWLTRGYRRFSTIMSSVAIEHLISARKSNSANELRNLAADLSGKALGQRSKELNVVGRDNVMEVLLRQAVSAYFSCAEVSWARTRIEKTNKTNAFKTCQEFLQWRKESGLSSAPTAASLYCLLSLGGNQEAPNVLKLRKTESDEVANGVFDACHASEFFNATQMSFGHQGPHRHVTVFATSDEGLAALCSLKAEGYGPAIRAGIIQPTPWIGRKKASLIRAEFHRQAIECSDNYFELDFLARKLNETSRTLVAMYSGEVPERITRLRRLCLGLLQKCAEQQRGKRR